MQELKIDSEFKNLIPALTTEEYKQLEEKIKNEGFDSKKYGSIIIWNGTIVDGHNRYEICRKNNIRFETEPKQFDSRDDVKEWIIRNQFGRRNLSTYQRSELALKLEVFIRAKAKENQKTHTSQGYQKTDKAEKYDTNKVLGQIAGVSHDTIHKVRVIQNEGTSEIKQMVRDGEMSIKKAFEATRPKKEESKVQKPTQLENEQKEDDKKIEKNQVKQPEVNTESIFNIAYFQVVVNSFLEVINPLSYAKILISEMDETIQNQYLHELKRIMEWVEKIENNIKTTMEV